MIDDATGVMSPINATFAAIAALNRTLVARLRADIAKAVVIGRGTNEIRRFLIVRESIGA